MNIFVRLKRFSVPNWLLILLSVVFVIHIPSFLEPYYYGDEMIYLSLGDGIRKGLVLYKDVHDNKPPLLYFLASISGNLFWFRVILCAWMLATILLFWKLNKKIFKNQKTAIVSTIVFGVLTSLPFFEGEVANAELFMLAPTIIAFLLVWNKPNYKNILLAGGFMSAGALFKIPSIFDAGVVIVLWLFSLKLNSKSVKDIFLKTIIFGIGIATPIALTFLWYWSRGAFKEYLVAAFLQNFGYVSSWRASTTSVPFLVKNAPLLFRALLVLVSFILTFLLRKKYSKVFLFSCLWLTTSLFAATLSERPYPHYFVQVLPSISLFIGLLLTDEGMDQVFSVIPLTIAFLVPVYFGFWQYSTSLYFGRFESLVENGNESSNYFSKFSPFIERNYQLAKFIELNTTPQDKVFVWGDSAGIYALSKRLPPVKYVADYHIKDFSSDEEVISSLEKNLPKILIILNEATANESISSFAQSHYKNMEVRYEAKLWYNMTLVSH